MVYNNDKLIAAAFVKARAKMGATVGKDAKGNFGRYATLAAITEAISQALSDNGLAIIQEASMDETGVTIETTLLHESGATMQFTPLTMPLSQRTPQAVGSATTYGRRYALAAICGLAPDDDDGQAAENATAGAQRAQTPAKAQAPAPAQKTPQRASTPATAGTQHDPAAAMLIDPLNALGEELYAENWPQVREHNTLRVSKDRTPHFDELKAAELQTLIDGMNKVKNKRLAEVDVAGAQPVAH